MPLDDLRPAWRAGAPLRPLAAVPHRARLGIVWHWAGPPTGLHGKPHAECLKMVRAWQLYHQSKDWKDLGYNALVCPHARAIEGRGLGYSGSHSPSWNTNRWGVQFMVGQGERVTDAMYERAIRLSVDLEALAGHALDDKRHLDDPKVSTACPGQQIATWVAAGGPDTQEEDMELTKEQLDEIAEAVWSKQLPKPGNDKTQSAGSQLAAANVYGYRAWTNRVNVGEVAQAVIAGISNPEFGVEDLAKAIVVELGRRDDDTEATS